MDETDLHEWQVAPLVGSTREPFAPGMRSFTTTELRRLSGKREDPMTHSLPVVALRGTLAQLVEHYREAPEEPERLRLTLTAPAPSAVQCSRWLATMGALLIDASWLLTRGE
jgi:hypothetical protein